MMGMRVGRKSSLASAAMIVVLTIPRMLSAQAAQPTPTPQPSSPAQPVSEPTSFPLEIFKPNGKSLITKDPMTGVDFGDHTNDTRISIAPYDEIVVTAVGDVMLGTTFPDDSPLPPNDGAGLLDEVTPLLKRGDVVFGNLEGPL